MLSNEPTYEKEESKRKTIFLPELSNCRPKSAGGGKFAEKFAEKEKIYKFAFVSSFRQSVFQLKKPFKVVAGPGRQTYKDVTGRLSSASNFATLIYSLRRWRNGNVHLGGLLSHLAAGVDYALYHPGRGPDTLLILSEGGEDLMQDGQEYNSHVFFVFIRSD